MSFQPEVYGKYYLVDRIAVGGMAEIFKAKIFGPGGFEKLLVIKRILLHLSQNDDFVDMFMDEARISSTLNHSNIVHIFDFGKIKDNYFIAMEFLEGRDLKTLMKKCQRSRRPLPMEFAVYIVHEMCKALDHAHHKKDSQNRELNILHRDISPSNVLLSYDEGRIKLADFGIAKAEGATYKTQAGVLKGKFEYMSPEQASGKKVDRRSDVFATGIVLYELLTRRRLFKAGSDLETLEMIRHPNVPPPSHLSRNIPPELDAIVMKALAADADQRYQEAWELQRDLRAFMRPNSPDILAQQLSRFTKELFSQEIEEERERLERGSRLIREAIKTGSMAEELALDDNFSVPDEGSFDHPSTQISFNVGAAPAERRRVTALLVVLAVVIAGTALLYWLDRPAPPPAVVAVPQSTGGGDVASPSLGTLVVGTEPSNARVYLDDQLIGTSSPLSYERVQLNKAQWVRVEAPGYAPERRPVFVTEAVPRETLQFELKKVEEAPEEAAAPPNRPAPSTTVSRPAPQPAAAPPTSDDKAPPQAVASLTGAPGKLNLVSNPPGATVYVDGKKACQAPCEFPAREANQAVKLAFKMAGWELYQSNVTVPAGGEATVKANLVRAEMGKLSVTLTEQVPVEILVDGLRQGYGIGITRLPVTAGEHQLTLRNPGLGINKTVSVTIKAGEVTQLDGINPRE